MHPEAIVYTSNTMHVSKVIYLWTELVVAYQAEGGRSVRQAPTATKIAYPVFSILPIYSFFKVKVFPAFKCARSLARGDFFSLLAQPGI